MARATLLAGGVALLVGGIAALLVAAFGTAQLEGALPPLAIDTDALRGAVVAIGLALMVLGALHIAVLIGLRTESSLAFTTAILLCATLAATCVALAAASVTSAAADPGRLAPFIAGGLAAAIAAVGYAVAARQLLGEARRQAAD